MTLLPKTLDLGLVGLVVLLLGFGSDTVIQPTVSERPTRALTLRDPSGEVHVSADASFVRHIEPRQNHRYRMPLNDGQYIQIAVSQREVDVALRLLGDSDQPLIEVDSPTGAAEDEFLHVVGDDDKTLTLEIVSQDLSAGNYEVRVEGPRTASLIDQTQVTAQEAFFASIDVAVSDDEPQPGQPEGDRTKNLFPSQNQTRVYPKRPVQRKISAGTQDIYQVDLQAHQYLHVIVEQHGIDVIVQLFDPTGQLLKIVDSPNGSKGSEELNEIAKFSGLYRLEIRAPKGDSKPGEYTLNIEALRKASEVDRSIVASDRSFSEAERLLASGPEFTAEALKKYREALGLQKRPRQQPRKADILYGMARAQESLGNRHQALKLYEDALGEYRSLGDQDREAALLNRQAMVHQWLGDLESALKLYQKALALFDLLGDEVGVVIVLGRLGTVQSSRGEIQKALDALGAALQKSRSIGDRRQEAIALTNLGHIFLTLDRNSEAFDVFSQALEINETRHDLKEIAIDLKGLADTTYQMAQLDDAVDFLQRSLQIRQALEDLRGQAVALNTLGEIYLRQDRMDRAHASLREALRIAQQAAEPHSQAIILTNMGRLYVSTGEPQRGLVHYDEALSLFQSIGDLRGEASSLAGSARALRDLKRFTDALERIEEAIDVIESLRTRPQRSDLRISYFASRQDYYEIAIDVLMHLHELNPFAGYDYLAVHAHERRLARTLLDALAEPHTYSNDTSLIEMERGLQRRLNQLSWPSSSHIDPSLEKQIIRTTAELDHVQGEIRQANPQTSNRGQHLVLSVSEIQRDILDEETLLLIYALGESRSFLWLISRRELISRVLPARSEIERMARRLSRSLSKDFRRQHQTQLSSELSEMLIAPIAGKLVDAHRLVFVTEGSLQSLAFSALPNPNARPAATPLVVSHEVTQLPSASVLALLRQRLEDRPIPPKTVAVLADAVYEAGDSRFGASENGLSAAKPVRWQEDLGRAAREMGLEGFKRLPYAQMEAESILAMVPNGQGLRALGFDASRLTATSRQLQDYRIVHFATHALLNRDHPELSGIVLSLLDWHGRPQDGFLRVHEIYSLDLPVELIVLSACETGLGKDVRGEGLLGLARVFLFAGASRVIVSLWKVSDRATAELMTRFYKAHFLEGLPPAAALRDAQVSMLQDPIWSAPRYWAGFILQGEWRDT